MSTSTAALSDGAILTVDDARRTLGVSSLAVARLIARGKLAATPIGNAGPLRIMGADMTAYVKKGAPDVDLPPLAGSWFSAEDTRQAAGFQAAVFKAMEGQWPTTATIQSMASRDKDQMYFSLTVNAEGGRAAIMQAPPTPLPGKPANRLENLGQIYLADAWREAVKKEMFPRGDVATLYSSPEIYRLALDAGWALVQKKVLSMSKPYAVQRRTAENVIVSLELPVSSLNSFVNRAKLESLTF